MNTFDTREQWLAEAVRILQVQVFGPKGYTVPDVRVSLGWPRGGRSTIGQCFPGALAKDAIGQVFISPVLEEPTRVLDVLVHELVHSINHKESKTGHGRDFKTIAVSVGLAGKMTATHASPELKDRLKLVSEELGPFPHSALSEAPMKANRSGRNVKLVCQAGEDFTVSISKTRLSMYGAPSCPCHSDTMVID